MDRDEAIRARAYQIWEEEGRPHGRQHIHWLQAMQEHGASSGGTEPAPAATDSHPGMMGDGTEEQNLNQTGNPGARITQAEVEEAFGSKKG